MERAVPHHGVKPTKQLSPEGVSNRNSIISSKLSSLTPCGLDFYLDSYPWWGSALSMGYHLMLFELWRPLVLV